MLTRRPGPALIVCRDCGCEWPTTFMVRDSVWCGEAGLPKRGCVLCLTCFRKVLGRPLTVRDFAPVPVNELLFAGFRMGVDTQETALLLGPAAAMLNLSQSQARRVLDAAGGIARDSSGRRVVSRAVLGRLIAERARKPRRPPRTWATKLQLSGA